MYSNYCVKSKTVVLGETDCCFAGEDGDVLLLRLGFRDSLLLSALSFEDVSQ